MVYFTRGLKKEAYNAFSLRNDLQQLHLDGARGGSHC